MSAETDALRDEMLDLWRKQSDLNHALSGEIDQLHAELAEARDGMTALSNRLEAVTRTVGGGLHSVASGPIITAENVRDPGGEWRPR